MVEELEKVSIIDKVFTFVKYKKGTLIYQNIDTDLEQINILEIAFSNKEKRIKKVDIYTLCDSHDTNLVESLHIIRGVDKVTEVDYYPMTPEYVSINGHKKLGNLSIFQTYTEEDTKGNLDSSELVLTIKGSKKKKKLIGLSIRDDLFITKENKFYQLNSYSINKLKRLTEFLIPSIIQIEKTMFSLKEKLIEEQQKNSEVQQEESEILVLDNVEEYPDSVYVYDRNYDLAGVRNQALVYMDTQFDNIELEIYLNAFKTRINEVRFLYNKETKNMKSKTQKKIIRIIKNDDNEIKVSLCNRKKESIYLNNHLLDKVSIRAESRVSKTGKIEWMNVILDTQIGRFDLIESHDIGVGFIDKNNKEYKLSSSAYVNYKMMVSLSPYIIKGLENKLITDMEEEKAKKLLMKN